VSRTEDPSGVEAAATIGERLRTVRRQQDLTLHEVEVASGLEFKASVLGAYERGERTVTLPRLQRLARHYQVPVAALLHHEEGAAASPDQRPLTIDLAALRHREGTDATLINRYLRALEVERGDYNGRVLTVRRSDTLALASILTCPPDHVRVRLRHMGVLIQ
jgi:transcriptional regulator with XRE-family HTH domain